MKRLLSCITLCLWLAFSVAYAAAQPSFQLRDGDRIVFLGDSITEQRIYTRYVMDYLTLRYPEMSLSFRNAGWVSDTAGGGLKRLQRDVLSLQPTVVTICYGMNDGGVGAFNRVNYERFISSMEELVQQIRTTGARVALLTPGVVDPDRKNWNSPERMRAYNPTLGQFARGEVMLARRLGVPIFNIHTLMLNAQTQAKSERKDFTMIPDGVHPDSAGHALMAYGLIQALGCNQPAASLKIGDDRLTSSRCRVKVLAHTSDKLVFLRRDEALPMAFDPAADVLFPYEPELIAMNRYELKVKNLTPGKWKLTVNGKAVAEMDGSQLSAGVDLAPLPGPWRELAKQVDQLCREQESAYYTRWRKVELADAQVLTPGERASELRKLDAQIAELERKRRTVVSGRTWKWELVRVP